MRLAIFNCQERQQRPRFVRDNTFGIGKWDKGEHGFDGAGRFSERQHTHGCRHDVDRKILFLNPRQGSIGAARVSRSGLLLASCSISTAAGPVAINSFRACSRNR